MTFVKRQHYVPRFYLRNFTFDTDQKMLNCFDKNKGSHYPCNIRNAAQQDLYYESDVLLPNEIENKFSSYESRVWSPSLKLLIRLRNFAKLNNQERANVLHFVALQHIRTPYDKDSIVGLNNSITRRANEKLGIEPN